MHADIPVELTPPAVEAYSNIHTLTSSSANADPKMLVDWVHAMPEPPKEIRLVHAEEDAQRALATVLKL